MEHRAINVRLNTSGDHLNTAIRNLLEGGWQINAAFVPEYIKADNAFPALTPKENQSQPDRYVAEIVTLIATKTG